MLYTRCTQKRVFGRCHRRAGAAAWGGKRRKAAFFIPVRLFFGKGAVALGNKNLSLAGKVLRNGLWQLLSWLPKDSRKAVCQSFYGRGYSDSPKAVAESLEYILPALDHGLAVLSGTAGDCGSWPVGLRCCLSVFQMFADRFQCHRSSSGRASPKRNCPSAM